MSQPKTTCPACGGTTAAPASFLTICSLCGHRWLPTAADERSASVQEIFTPDYAGYRPDPAFVEATAKLIGNELIPRVPPPAGLLDVGCGGGEFMAVAQGLGYEVEGIDISRASAEICVAKGLKAMAADFTTQEFASEFDLITMWDVVSHLPNPETFLIRARLLLRENGRLFAKVPGVGQFSVRVANRFPRLAGAILGAPSHIQFFNHDSLKALLRRTGFELQWIEGGSARSRKSGGSFKRRAARRLAAAVKRISGDRNMYVIARPR